MVIPPEIESRFRRLVRFGAASECWEWVGSIHKSGYGRYLMGKRPHRRPVAAHRLSWMLHTGSEIPDGLWVLHRCDNRKCVNPQHLFLGTAQDNTTDMMSKGRHVPPRGERNGGVKITTEQVLEIRRLHRAGLSTRSLSRMFPVGKSSVDRIVRGESWSHV